MQWSTGVVGAALVARPQGRIDETSWEPFLAQLTAATSAAGDAQQDLVLDLAAVDYMSSRGLRALTMAKREADARGIKIQLANPNERMREILAISRYDKLFEVVGSAGPPA